MGVRFEHRPPQRKRRPWKPGAPLSLGNAYAIPLVCRALTPGGPSSIVWSYKPRLDSPTNNGASSQLRDTHGTWRAWPRLPRHPVYTDARRQRCKVCQ